MRYQKIHSQIWNDEKFVTLTPSQQRLFLYILTCPHGNIIGFFVLKLGYICDDLKSSQKDIAKDLQKLIEIGAIDYDFNSSVILLKNFLKHNPITNPNQVKAAVKMVRELPNNVLFQSFIEVLPEVLKEVLSKGLRIPSVSVSVSVSEEDPPNPSPDIPINKIIPPLLEWVQNYCRERGHIVNPETFFHFYEAKGWMIGKNKMKDWHSAMWTWEKTSKPKQTPQSEFI